jgi:hypothetical protein
LLPESATPGEIRLGGLVAAAARQIVSIGVEGVELIDDGARPAGPSFRRSKVCRHQVKNLIGAVDKVATLAVLGA